MLKTSINYFTTAFGWYYHILARANAYFVDINKPIKQISVQYSEQIFVALKVAALQSSPPHMALLNLGPTLLLEIISNEAASCCRN